MSSPPSSDVNLDVDARRVHDLSRTLGLGQEHDALHSRRLREPDRWRYSARMARACSRRRRTSAISAWCSSATRCFRICPSARILPFRSRSAACPKAEIDATGARDAEARPPRRLRGPQAGADVGWPAAARRAGAGARLRSAGASDGRAALGARQEAARGNPVRDPPHPSGDRSHHPLRHARSGGGAAPLRPHRRVFTRA